MTEELTDIHGIGPEKAEQIRAIVGDNSEVDPLVREAHKHAQNGEYHKCTQMLEQAMEEL